MDTDVRRRRSYRTPTDLGTVYTGIGRGVGRERCVEGRAFPVDWDPLPVCLDLQKGLRRFSDPILSFPVPGT